MDNDLFFQAMNIMKCICNESAAGNAFKGYWSNNMRCEDIDKTFESIKNKEPYNTHEFWKEVFALPESHKKILGFKKWSEDIKEMNIPIWIWQLLPDDMEFDGKLKKDLDNEIRFGCVFWRA